MRAFTGTETCPAVDGDIGSARAHKSRLRWRMALNWTCRLAGASAASAASLSLYHCNGERESGNINIAAQAAQGCLKRTQTVCCEKAATRTASFCDSDFFSRMDLVR